MVEPGISPDVAITATNAAKQADHVLRPADRAPSRPDLKSAKPPARREFALWLLPIIGDLCAEAALQSGYQSALRARRRRLHCPFYRAVP